MKGKELVAEILKREGVEFLPCYPAQELIDPCAKLGIKPIVCRQERMGMAIADGYSRINNGNKIGVFTMQRGPGSENAFPGAAQAYSDNSPILILPGGEDTHQTGISPVFSPSENYKNITKWSIQANHVERIPNLLRKAFYELKTGKGSPVLVEIPIDILETEYEDKVNYTPPTGNKIRPDSNEVREVAKFLISSKTPVIHAGQGCLYAEAWTELQDIATLLDAPVMTTNTGKSAFPENHPLSLGAAGRSVTGHGFKFMQESDVIFGIGCSFSKTAYNPQIPANKTIIHSTNDPFDINKDQQSQMGLVGDAKLTLQSLIEEIKSLTDGKGRTKTRNVKEEVLAAKAEWLSKWNNQLCSDETPLNQYRIINDLMATVDREHTIITHDAGSPRDQLVSMWECVAPRTYIGWGKSTQLGFGLGVIMGAKLAKPDYTCINIMGDAAIGMVGLDIETAVRNNLGIITIVFNNGIMAIESDHMPYAAKTYDAIRQDGNYAEIAKALGAWSKIVKSPDEIIPSIKEAIKVSKTGQPVLLDCHVKAGFDFSIHKY